MNYELDARYMDIGDLPTGGVTYDFDRIFMRQFILEELPLLHHGMTSKTRPHQHIIRAVQLACSVDINQLTDGDFCYVMAWLRRSSFPEFPVQARYTCNHMVYVNENNKIGFDVTAKTAYKRGFWLQPCGHVQSELVKNTQVKVHTLEDDDLVIQHPDIDFARVQTLTDYYEHVDEDPRMKYVGSVARWVKRGTTYKAKLAYLMAQPDMKLFEEIERHMKKYFHGITEVVKLRCGQCNNVKSHESNPSLLTFFADNTDKDIYNMCYNLMSQFGASPDMKLPVRMFLYHHSTLAADRREAEQKAKAAAGRTMGTRRGIR